MQYIPPRVIDPTTLPEVRGFKLIISDNRTTRRLFLPGAQVRGHFFNSSFLQAANITGNVKTIWVVAETAAESSPSESIPFSGIMQSSRIHHAPCNGTFHYYPTLE